MLCTVRNLALGPPASADGDSMPGCRSWAGMGRSWDVWAAQAEQLPSVSFLSGSLKGCQKLLQDSGHNACLAWRGYSWDCRPGTRAAPGWLGTDGGAPRWRGCFCGRMTACLWKPPAQIQPMLARRESEPQRVSSPVLKMLTSPLCPRTTQAG